MIRILISACLTLLLMACSSDDSTSEIEISAIPLHDEAVGHYCNMLLSEHSGPQAQIHIESQSEPLWFSQVRDALAFTRLPEETATISAIFVNDMAIAPSWDTPGENNWISVETARFVIGSESMGGMGAPEAIPFGTEAAAEVFIAEHGGEVVAFADISDEYVLAPVEIMHHGSDHTPTISPAKERGMPMDAMTEDPQTMQHEASPEANTMSQSHDHE